MNIQRICNAQLNIIPMMSRADNQKSNFGVRMAQPLSVDTVSFQGKTPRTTLKELAAIARKEARALRDARQIAEAKKAPDKSAPTKKNLSGEERKRGVPRSTATQIHNQILKPQKQIHNFIHKIFDDLVVTQTSPKNPILKLSNRPKGDISIMEKSATRDWNSINEILENMTDLNGAKIVFNYKTGRSEAETVLDRLIPLIKTKQVILKEIELQRPKAIEIHNPKTIESLYKKDQEEFDYVSKSFLDKLEDAQEEVINGLETDVDKIKLVDRPLPKYTKGNYCALHLILQSTEKGSRPFELQVMGARMSDGKAFDDKRFKFFDGKELDKMYEPLIRLWKRLMPEENIDAKERFLQYCKDANLQLRKDELQEYNTKRLMTRPNGFFISVRGYGLPPEYDLNFQYKLLRSCEAEAAVNEVKEESTVKKIEQKVSAVEKRVVGLAKEKVEAAKEKVETAKEKVELFQKLVAKYAPKHLQNTNEKKKTKV